MSAGPSFFARYINCDGKSDEAANCLSTYEEPHGCAEAGRDEAVERASRVNVDGVVTR